MDNGWIKIHRKFLEWEWFQNSEMVHLFFYLILSANHRNKRWRGMVVKRGQLVTGRHQLSDALNISEQTMRTCLKRLVESNSITIKSTNKFSVITVCNYDDYQKKEEATNQPTNQQLTSKNKPFSGSFTDGVKKTKKINQPTNQQENTANPTEMGVYDNEKEHANQQTNQQLTNNQPTTNQQLTTNKNVKNVKNVKNKNIPEKKFLPAAYQLQEFSKKHFHEKYLDEGSLDVFDKLIRLDGYSAEDIQRSILFARGDDFWTKNFLTPKKLRKKNPEGVLYIDVFLAQTVKTNEGIKRGDRGASLADLAEIVQREFGDYPVR